MEDIKDCVTPYLITYKHVQNLSSDDNKTIGKYEQYSTGDGAYGKVSYYLNIQT